MGSGIDLRWLLLGSVAGGVLLAPGLGRATDFTVGGWQGSFYTTVSAGVLERVKGRDPNLIGRANGGNSPNTNLDNGDLNWGKGPVSAPIRATEELQLDKNDFGFFARATESSTSSIPTATRPISSRCRMRRSTRPGSAAGCSTPMATAISTCSATGSTRASAGWR